MSTRRDRPAEAARFTAAAAAVADAAARPRGARHRRRLGGAGDHGHAGAGPGLARRRREADQRRAPRGRARWSAPSTSSSTMFTQLGGLMAERVTDLRDIRDRVIAELNGLPEPGVPVPDVPSILCAEDLAPADTAGLDPSLVVALATTLGGPTSHTAIIARQLGIPCVVAVDGLDAVAVGHHGAGRRHPRHRHRAPDRGRRATPSPSAQREAELASAVDRARRHRRRTRRRDPGQRAGRRRRPRRRARLRPRASGCSAPNCASSTATPNRASTSRRRSTARCSTRSRATRSSSARSTPARTSR